MIPNPVLFSAIIGAVAVLALSVDFRAIHPSKMYTDRLSGGTRRRLTATCARRVSTGDQSGINTASLVERDVLLAPSLHTTGRRVTAVRFLNGSLTSIVSDAWPGVVTERGVVSSLELTNRVQAANNWPALGGNGGRLDASHFRSLADSASADRSVTKMLLSVLRDDTTSPLGGVDRWHS